jgi:hypothetical protein
MLFASARTAIVTSLVVGGVAWALQSPVDGNGVIHACYNPTTGAMHLNVKGTCPTTGQKTPITWNAQGPQGPPGRKAHQHLVADTPIGVSTGHYLIQRPVTVATSRTRARI